MDLACLLRIVPGTTLEKLGSAINSSIFDASNTAGSLKQKGLIDFTASYPGPNTVTITDAGKALIAEADSQITAPIDALDEAVLTQISGGKRIPIDLQNTLNIRPKDLAMRIYKLYKIGLLTYDLKSGGVDLLLTDQGFIKAKSSAVSNPQPQVQNNVQTQKPAAHAEQNNDEATIADLPLPQNKKRPYLQIIIIIIVIALVAYYVFKTKL